jgi:hypothetical protein
LNKSLLQIIAVLASAWFFPVSCTTAMGIGASILVESDARDAARGDTVHSSIAVVAVPPPEAGRAFGHLLLGNVPSYKDSHPDASFVMPAAEGRIELDGHMVVSYKVVAASGAEQTIETQYADGDRSAWGRYRAGRREVTPLASRLSVQDYIYSAMPYALVIALIIYVGAVLARRRFSAPRGRPAP